jgi:hypothetical protein
MTLTLLAVLAQLPDPSDRHLLIQSNNVASSTLWMDTPHAAHTKKYTSADGDAQQLFGPIDIHREETGPRTFLILFVDAFGQKWFGPPGRSSCNPAVASLTGARLDSSLQLTISFVLYVPTMISLTGIMMAAMLAGYHGRLSLVSSVSWNCGRQCPPPLPEPKPFPEGQPQ